MRIHEGMQRVKGGEEGTDEVGGGRGVGGI